MPLEYFCKTCKRTMDESNFYSSYNLEKYPTGKLAECKKCCTMTVDNFNPDTFLPLLEEIDIPYVPNEWMALVTKYCKDPTKVTGMTIIGRYISKMRLKQWRDFRYKDSEYLQNLEITKQQQALKSAGYSAAEIDQYVREAQEAQAQRPALPPIQSLAGMAPSQGLNDGLSQTAAPQSAYQPVPDYFTDELTEEDKKYLYLKWGNYRPDEWVKLEQLYEEFLSSYDIQSAGHIDTLKLICKTSLKANQLVDLNDIEGYQKMSKVYDQLMKSGKFTAAQNKGESNNFVDSISELVTMCEEQGYIERFYTDEPKDKVDQVLWDTKNYLHSLVTEEMNLGTLIENAIKQIQEEQIREKEMEEELGDDFDDDEIDSITEEDYDEFREFIQEQKEADEEEEK